MVRITDLPDYEQAHLLSKNMPPLGPACWTKINKPLNQFRIALVTTAGLHSRDDANFGFTDATFRPIPDDENPNNLVMSHSSVNFDRTGFAEDVNLVFPTDRFHELVKSNTIGSLASIHYSFMGAGLLPEQYEQSASQVAGLLKKDLVDAVFLTPV
ncbi:MAG: selenoprotein B glycine/betaine/sarcosine/D-proline reductase [Pseudomonadales bacterium]|nr:selenoprotein B glycine/betaine/sarcosine/D-proline reductase [Pseudomonadales bacterium]